MKKVNFKQLEVYTDITRTNKVTGDGRREFADLMYKSCNGIAAHALALKIYQSEGEIEIDDQEESLIRELAERSCTPAFIDAINRQLNQE